MALNNSLNVFFAVDKNYLIHFTVTLTSLLENNKDLDLTVYIIHDMEDRRGLDNVVNYFNSNYNVIINLVFVDNSIFDNFQITLYISKATYFRLLFADILPKNIFSGLYLDCDTIVTGSLKELTNPNFKDPQNCNEEKSILAVCDKNEKVEIERLKSIGIYTNMYFNAGVMIINLKEWRDQKVSDKLIEIATKYKDNLMWWDQDVLNIFFRNKCGKLNSTYNEFPAKVLDIAPLIIHFSGSSKPWHYFNNHPYKSIYRKYLFLTPFKNEKFEKVTIKKVIKKYILSFKY